MGVSIRLSKHTRMYLPFWLALPAWMIIAACYMLVFLTYGLVWLMVKPTISLAHLIGTSQARRRRSGAQTSHRLRKRLTTVRPPSSRLPR